ncbi:nuclease-related domain-containing protein [Filibacter tadaridae]|uniref:Nuclease-related domain protein n=1 Tax=Filibacter tadaridae TaxID=2483811 RepID=A0A3P5WLF8_9BACL|nr:Nuclease-related domain protein [Filibacter tadaridae]
MLLEGLDAAIKRLPIGHKSLPSIESKLASLKAGFGGEQQLDKVFENYTFPMKHCLFHDISLTSSTHFQMDTLFITPFYAVIFEVKNITGDLKVTENPPQLIRKLDTGQVNGFKSPIAQVQNNCELLRDWLYSRNTSLPIYGVVVLAYAKQRVELFDTNVPFLYPNTVPTYIRQLPTESPKLDDETFKKITNDLCNSHREFTPPPICMTYQIKRNEIRTGVTCPFCSFFGMKKYMKGWRCEGCNSTSPDAHKQAVRDWFLLFGGKMMNKDCRKFLHIEKQQTANRIMKSMELYTEGANRNRTYRMDFKTKHRERT